MGTINGACASFEENRKGSITAGNWLTWWCSAGTRCASIRCRSSTSRRAHCDWRALGVRGIAVISIGSIGKEPTCNTKQGSPPYARPLMKATPAVWPRAMCLRVSEKH